MTRRYERRWRWLRGAGEYWTVAERKDRLFYLAHRLQTASNANSMYWVSANVCRMDRRNSSFTTMSCACSSLAFLWGIISWSVDSTYYFAQTILCVIRLHSVTRCRVVLWEDWVVSVWIRYWLEGRGSNTVKGEVFHTSPDRPWGLASLLLNGYRSLTRR
jgi:hypothetical protein